MSEPMKATAMVPDSTQSGNGEKDRQRTTRKKKKLQPPKGKRKDGSDGNRGATKKKKTTAKKKVQGVKDRSFGGEEKDGDVTSDLDLTKPLFALGHYINDREEMLNQAFQSVSKEQLIAMIPDALKDCPVEVLKAMCLGQLEGMSKKRIQHVLVGEEMLSSSDTDESGNELDEDRMEDQPGETGDGDKEAETHQVQVEENTDVVTENEEGAGLVQDEVEGEGLMEEYQEDCQEELEAEEVVHPIVKLEPMSDTSPERSTGGHQSPAIYQENQESEREYLNVRSPLIKLEGEGETTDSKEEQTAEKPVPVKRRKKRKNTGVKKIVNPADLEEGEVEDASSEYTEGSEEDSDTDVKETDKPGEIATNVCQEEVSDRVIGAEGDETNQVNTREEGISRKKNDVNIEDDDVVKQEIIMQCVEHENQDSVKSEGASKEEHVLVTSDKHAVTSQMSANGDALSVNNESELEDEQVEVEETSQQPGEMEEPLSTTEDLYDKELNDSDSAKKSVEVDEVEPSSSQDGQSDQSDLIKSNNDKVAEVALKTETITDKNELTEPRLDVLELELRARAIRSLMKHCINEKK